jgi:hypothetical protein
MEPWIAGRIFVVAYGLIATGRFDPTAIAFAGQPGRGRPRRASRE